MRIGTECRPQDRYMGVVRRSGTGELPVKVEAKCIAAGMSNGAGGSVTGRLKDSGSET